MNKLFDLRFVIGLFFVVVGVLLLGYTLLGGENSGTTINRWTSGVFLVFGMVMIVFARNKKE